MKNRNRIMILCISFFASFVKAKYEVKLNCEVNGKIESIDWIEKDPTPEKAQAKCVATKNKDAKFVNFIVGNI